ncbi:hypothetical protein B0O80DRAFT_440465 [Mortierella sp. GBAus27b]|nr:hypothetical protein B0O80DRAFT_440465 [Mortierella sp. GBAus27b]
MSVRQSQEPGNSGRSGVQVLLTHQVLARETRNVAGGHSSVTALLPPDCHIPEYTGYLCVYLTMDHLSC